jgi:hypothetical protein
VKIFGFRDKLFVFWRKGTYFVVFFEKFIIVKFSENVGGRFSKEPDP